MFGTFSFTTLTAINRFIFKGDYMLDSKSRKEDFSSDIFEMLENRCSIRNLFLLACWGMTIEGLYASLDSKDPHTRSLARNAIGIIAAVAAVSAQEGNKLQSCKFLTSKWVTYDTPCDVFPRDTVFDEVCFNLETNEGACFDLIQISDCGDASDSFFIRYYDSGYTVKFPKTVSELRSLVYAAAFGVHLDGDDSALTVLRLNIRCPEKTYAEFVDVTHHLNKPVVAKTAYQGVSFKMARKKAEESFASLNAQSVAHESLISERVSYIHNVNGYCQNASGKRNNNVYSYSIYRLLDGNDKGFYSRNAFVDGDAFFIEPTSSKKMGNQVRLFRMGQQQDYVEDDAADLLDDARTLLNAISGYRTDNKLSFRDARALYCGTREYNNLLRSECGRYCCEIFEIYVKAILKAYSECQEQLAHDAINANLDYHIVDPNETYLSARCSTYDGILLDLCDAQGNTIYTVTSGFVGSFKPTSLDKVCVNMHLLGERGSEHVEDRIFFVTDLKIHEYAKRDFDDPDDALEPDPNFSVNMQDDESEDILIESENDSDENKDMPITEVKENLMPNESDMVEADDGFNRKYYNQASGIIKPIDLLACLPFELGTACKYLLRAPYKGQSKEDYKKAVNYLNRVLADTAAGAGGLRSKYLYCGIVWHLLKCFDNEYLSALYETRLQEEELQSLIERIQSEQNLTNN